MTIAPKTPPETTTKPFEIGLFSFVETGPDPITGATISSQQRMHNILETIELADQVGLDVFGLASITARISWPPRPL
jgi:hypothetical protein